MSTPTPEQTATEAARTLAALTGTDSHDIAVVLGSGWQSAADALGAPFADLRTTELPGFAPPAVSGHPGTVRSIRSRGTNVLVFLGRTHLYEGHGTDAVAHAVRTAAAAGCRAVVLTNGAGSVQPSFTPGAPVVISDHLNLTGASPLTGPRFVDLTNLYSPRLRTLCREVDPGLGEGVYAQFRGPQYETPAEIAMARTLGADLVGMSTAIEAIAAREAGMEVLGVSLVTNLAAGLSGAALDHADVLETGRAAADRVGALLAGVLPGI